MKDEIKKGMALPEKQQRSRTRGIEISKLAKGAITVSLWDMAGQLEYQAIHGFMFPDLSNRTSPSFFVFVFNPVHMDNQGQPQTDAHGRLSMKTSEDFRLELRYWLMFITSKTRRSNNFKPVLLVVITRKDCCDHAEIWISTSLNELRNQFEQYAVIHDKVFNVAARKASSVSHLTDCVFGIAENILKSADDVPRICEDVLASISEGLSNKTIRPLVTKQEFETLCEDLFPTIESERVEAIALSLNDSGDLIYLHSLDFVVVDTKWFSHTIMGNLIHLSEENNRVNVSSHMQAAKPGFVPVKYLESLLQDLMQAEQKKSIFKSNKARPQVAVEQLMKLLQGLHLACLEEDGDITREDAHMFVPAMLPPAESRPHWRRGDGEQFLGRRLRCRDSDHTFLTPGIFPLIQVKLQSLFRQNRNMELQRSAAGFICDGVEVWVELAEDEGGFKCIDILARSVKDHDSTLLWVKERVMEEIQKVCASDKGIQGVTLEEMVIRPACVRNLGIEKERRSQCVPIDRLCKGLQDTLATESLGNSFKYAGFDWPSGDGLPAEWCRYIDLLGEKAALKICTPYAEKWYAAAKDTLGGTQSPKEEDQEEEFEPESKDLAEICKMLKEILVYARDTNAKVIEMQGQLQRMERSVDVLRDRVLQGMSEMLMFHKEMEGGRYPWMFVVTAATELNARRIITAMIPSVRDWKLELLCENPIGEPHLPRGQPGLPFATMENGVLKDALPYLNTFLKFASTAVRVGAHVATGFDIPDFSGILNLLPTLDDQAAPVTNTSCYPSRGTVGDAQQWLWNTLSKHGCKSSAEIYSKFKLQRVRRSNSCVVWVCDEHRGIGTPCD